MFADFEKLVLEDYQWKKNYNELSSHLIHPTPARVKKECLRLCRNELQAKDEKVIRDFCEVWDSSKTCLQNIAKCDIDKFRPLVKYLKGGTGHTDPKNIQLLAWLIDFPYRPFELGKKYVIPTKSEDIDGMDLVIERMAASGFARGNESALRIGEVSLDPVQDGISNTRPLKSRRLFSKIMFAGIWLAILGTGSYWWYIKLPEKNGGCMYWTGDHYQPIPCNEKMPNTLVIALDSNRMKNFKKITRPDTISHSSIGYVWYSKIDNNLEYFTADGNHPVYIQRHLKPITTYMIDKYIHPGMTTNK